MRNYKKCGCCKIIKSFECFHKDRTMNDNHSNRCIVCTKLYYKRYYQKVSDKKSRFIYKNIEDPKYIKDKMDLFREHGNGWWFVDKTRSSQKKRKRYL
tara:strand:+ start:290 stop:583 length:294 start_codon:yes stop_codon:yes gene_type:complete